MERWLSRESGELGGRWGRRTLLARNDEELVRRSVWVGMHPLEHFGRITQQVNRYFRLVSIQGDLGRCQFNQTGPLEKLSNRAVGEESEMRSVEQSFLSVVEFTVKKREPNRCVCDVRYRQDDSAVRSQTPIRQLPQHDIWVLQVLQNIQSDDAVIPFFVRSASSFNELHAAVEITVQIDHKPTQQTRASVVQSHGIDVDPDDAGSSLHQSGGQGAVGATNVEHQRPNWRCRDRKGMDTIWIVEINRITVLSPLRRSRRQNRKDRRLDRIQERPCRVVHLRIIRVSRVRVRCRPPT